MEIICIERTAWDTLVHRIGLLASEVEDMRTRHCPDARPGWLDSSDVCQLLNLSKRVLQTYRATGKISFSMLGGKVYFKQEDIAALLRAGFQHRKK